MTTRIGLWFDTMSEPLAYGFLNCNKPPGYTSRDVVNIVQSRCNTGKVGHAGTLDPLASGVLVIGVGPAVRLIRYVQFAPKEYLATFRLGVSSASGDLEQPLTEQLSARVPLRAEVQRAAETMVGGIEQTPPSFSAIKLSGRRACDRVRDGETVSMPTRTVTVYSNHLIRYEYPRLTLKVRCGSGTYIRTLGIDLAAKLGTVAVMESLVRTAVGKFQLDAALSIDVLKESPLQPYFRPALDGVTSIPQISVTPAELTSLCHGRCIPASPIPGSVQASQHQIQGQCRQVPASQVSVYAPTRAAGAGAGVSAARANEARQLPNEPEAAAVDGHGHLRAIVRWRDGRWCPCRVLSPPTDRAEL